MFIINSSASDWKLEMLETDHQELVKTMLLDSRAQRFSKDKSVTILSPDHPAVFYLIFTEGNSSQKYIKVTVRNCELFRGHYSILKLHFYYNPQSKELLVDMKKKFLSMEEVLSNNDVRMEVSTTLTQRQQEIVSAYDTAFGNVTDQLALIYLLIDTSLSPEKLSSDCDVIMNFLSPQVIGNMAHTFFGIITFGSAPEQFMNIAGKKLSNQPDAIKEAVASIQTINQYYTSNPFQMIFDDFREIRNSAPGLDLQCSILMVTEGAPFSNDISNGYGQDRDSLHVQVFGIRPNTNVKNLCNCENIMEFKQESKAGIIPAHAIVFPVRKPPAQVPGSNPTDQEVKKARALRNIPLPAKEKNDFLQQIAALEKSAEEISIERAGIEQKRIAEQDYESIIRDFENTLPETAGQEILDQIAQEKQNIQNHYAEFRQNIDQIEDKAKVLEQEIDACKDEIEMIHQISELESESLPPKEQQKIAEKITELRQEQTTIKRTRKEIDAWKRKAEKHKKDFEADKARFAVSGNPEQFEIWVSRQQEAIQEEEEQILMLTKQVNQKSKDLKHQISKTETEIQASWEGWKKRRQITIFLILGALIAGVVILGSILVSVLNGGNPGRGASNSDPPAVLESTPSTQIQTEEITNRSQIDVYIPPTETEKVITTTTPPATTAYISTMVTVPVVTVPPVTTTIPIVTAEKSYEVVRKKYTWEEAEMWCEQNGGHLATIYSDDDWSAIMKAISKTDLKYLWIGAKSYYDSMYDTVTLKWYDGTTADYLENTKEIWYYNAKNGIREPSGYDRTEEDEFIIEPYVFLFKVNGVWSLNDAPGSHVNYKDSNMGFLIEYD